MHALVQRVEAVVIELERASESVCVVAHEPVLRCVYAYFMQVPFSEVRPAAQSSVPSLHELRVPVLLLASTMRLRWITNGRYHQAAHQEATRYHQRAIRCVERLCARRSRS